MKHTLKQLALLLIVLAGCNSAPAVPAPIATKEDIIFKNTVVSLTFERW